MAEATIFIADAIPNINHPQKKNANPGLELASLARSK